MNIEYSNGFIITNKNSGSYLSKIAAASAPDISFGNLLEKGKYYTLIMHDPNAVNDNHNFVHWIVTNIQLTNKGHTFLEYKGPAPPAGSGIHNYIFTLYLQPDEFKLTNIEEHDRQTRMSPLLVKLSLQDAKIIDQVSFTSSFAEKGGKRKTRRKRNKQKKRNKKSRRR
jgi:phosphatidylethanolamine-binding protein (PEBP) family uncharacterized protein